MYVISDITSNSINWFDQNQGAKKISASNAADGHVKRLLVCIRKDLVVDGRIDFEAELLLQEEQKLVAPGLNCEGDQ